MHRHLSVLRRFSLLVLFTAGLRAGTVFDLSGHPADPFARSEARPVVLLFVRTDCPISNRYAPIIQDLAQKYSGRAEFWLIYPGKVQTAAAIQHQLREFGYHLRALRDTAGELATVSQASVTPEAAVFTSGKKLVYHGRIDNLYEGIGESRRAPSTHELDEALQAVNEGRLPAVSATKAVGCSLADLK